MRALALGVLGIAGAALAGLAWPVPDPPAFAVVRARSSSSEALLLDRHGEVLHERRVDARERRLAWTPLAEIGLVLRESVVAGEDRRFGAHSGVDVRALATALLEGLQGRPLRGASTLPMQLAALLDPALARAPAPVRKWRQIRVARRLVRLWSRDQILEAYLNLVSYRGELTGVRAAARGLFDREPHGLGAAESLLLAALLPAPNAPPERVARRACRLARSTRALADCATLHALAADVLARPPQLRARRELALHVATRLLRPGAPARVATTLDASLQRFVTSVLRRQVGALAERSVRDAAALVIDDASGAVRAYVGGIGRGASAPWVDGVRAPRQAGSSLKPFLYALALDRRLVTAATHLDDAPLEIGTQLGSYRPDNYDRAHRGRVPLRDALAGSLNIPAVRLLQLVGVEDFAGALRRLGFAGLRAPDHYGASLALGAADVSLWELAGAWHALARGGVFEPLRLEPGTPAPPGERVYSEAAAFIVLDVLADRSGRAGSFGLESPLGTRVWSAVKTGTSKEMRDNWCAGTTGRYTVAVWVGNASGEPMWDVSGVDGAAPAWLEIVHALHRNAPAQPPQPPPGLARAAGEWFLAGTEPPRSGSPAVRVAQANAGARIVAPQPGAVLALDPDIPDSHERVWFEAAPPDARLVLELDGRRLGTAAEPRLWTPQRGHHELTLVTADGRALDAVRFSVR